MSGRHAFWDAWTCPRPAKRAVTHRYNVCSRALAGGRGMSNRPCTTLFASALLAAVTGWSTPAAPSTGDALPPATGELEGLDRLASALRADLHVQQQRLD